MRTLYAGTRLHVESAHRLAAFEKLQARAASALDANSGGRGPDDG